MTLSAKFPLAALLAASLLAACAAGPSSFGNTRDGALFARIDTGMTQEEVLRALGPPDERMAFPLSRTVAWDYRGQDAWGYLVMFSVTFGADGRALGKTVARLNDGGDHGR